MTCITKLSNLLTLFLIRYSFGVITVEHNYQEPMRQQIRCEGAAHGSACSIRRMIPSDWLNLMLSLSNARRELLERNAYVLTHSVQWDDWYVHQLLSQSR